MVVDTTTPLLGGKRCNDEDGDDASDGDGNGCITLQRSSEPVEDDQRQKKWKCNDPEVCVVYLVTIELISTWSGCSSTCGFRTHLVDRYCVHTCFASLVTEMHRILVLPTCDTADTLEVFTHVSFGAYVPAVVG